MIFNDNGKNDLYERIDVSDVMKDRIIDKCMDVHDSSLQNVEKFNVVNNENLGKNGDVFRHFFKTVAAAVFAVAATGIIISGVVNHSKSSDNKSVGIKSVSNNANGNKTKDIANNSNNGNARNSSDSRIPNDIVNNIDKKPEIEYEEKIFKLSYKYDDKISAEKGYKTGYVCKTKKYDLNADGNKDSLYVRFIQKASENEYVKNNKDWWIDVSVNDSTIYTEEFEAKNDEEYGAFVIDDSSANATLDLSLIRISDGHCILNVLDQGYICFNVDLVSFEKNTMYSGINTEERYPFIANNGMTIKSLKNDILTVCYKQKDDVLMYTGGLNLICKYEYGKDGFELIDEDNWFKVSGKKNYTVKKDIKCYSDMENTDEIVVKAGEKLRLKRAHYIDSVEVSHYGDVNSKVYIGYDTDNSVMLRNSDNWGFVNLCFEKEDGTEIYFLPLEQYRNSNGDYSEEDILFTK